MVDKEELSKIFAAYGRKGGAARAKMLTSKERSEIAQKGAKARWSKPRKQNKKKKEK